MALFEDLKEVKGAFDNAETAALTQKTELANSVKARAQLNNALELADAIKVAANIAKILKAEEKLTKLSSDPKPRFDKVVKGIQEAIKASHLTTQDKTRLVELTEVEAKAVGKRVSAKSLVGLTADDAKENQANRQDKPADKDEETVVERRTKDIKEKKTTGQSIDINLTELYLPDTSFGHAPLAEQMGVINHLHSPQSIADNLRRSLDHGSISGGSLTASKTPSAAQALAEATKAAENKREGNMQDLLRQHKAK